MALEHDTTSDTSNLATTTSLLLPNAMPDFLPPNRQGSPATLNGHDLRLEVSTSNPPILLQILLRKEWRTAEGLAAVQKILTSLGLKLTASGLATISAEVNAERFESLFSVKATEIAPRGPGKADFGASGGHASPDLTVPSLLSRYVQSISAAPPHIYLQQ